MPVTSCGWTFDGHDPIMVFESLTRLTQEADLNQKTEAQASATLHRFLTGSKETMYEPRKLALVKGHALLA